MAFAIPKLEYKNGSANGSTTNGSSVITGLSNTEGIEANMFITGAGIPAGATVESVTEDSVTLANGAQATATASSVTFLFGHRIEFDYPPKEPKGEKLETNATTSVSLSGIRQVSVNHIEANRSPTFSFLSQNLYVLLNSFLQNCGLLGETFRFFEDKTLSSYAEYELDDLKVEWKKIAPKGEEIYVWELPLKFRRVL